MSDEALRVVTGSPTDEELAAITAVLTEVALARAASNDPLPDAPAMSAWMRSARGLRAPLPRGTWRH